MEQNHWLRVFYSWVMLGITKLSEGFDTIANQLGGLSLSTWMGAATLTYTVLNTYVLVRDKLTGGSKSKRRFSTRAEWRGDRRK